MTTNAVVKENVFIKIMFNNNFMLNNENNPVLVVWYIDGFCLYIFQDLFLIIRILISLCAVHNVCIM